ncbi:MAG: hypothetical protein Q4D14_01740 [Bacteroidales bacterium]|nr:hypothetical protein [Bacteroidales bacterium]
MLDQYTFIYWIKNFCLSNFAEDSQAHVVVWDSDTMNFYANSMATSLGHEIGHALGLSHIAYTSQQTTHYIENKCPQSIMSQGSAIRRNYLPASEVGHMHVALSFSKLQDYIPLGVYVGTKHISTTEDWPRGRFYYGFEIMPEGSLTLNCGATMPSRADIVVRGELNIGEEELVADQNNRFGGIRVMNDGVLKLQKSVVSQYDIVVENGGTLIVDDTITMANGHRILVRKGGYVCFKDNACLYLKSSDCKFQISNRANFGTKNDSTTNCTDHCTVIGNGSYEIIQSDYDLYLRDNETDNGTTTTMPHLLNSPDIQVINGSNGMVEDNSLQSGENYVVKLTVHNNGTEPSSGNERVSLYWGTPLCNAFWPNGWKDGAPYYCNATGDSIIVHGIIADNLIIGEQILPGSSIDMTIPWTADQQPNLTFDALCLGNTTPRSVNAGYALLAVIDDGLTTANIDNTVPTASLVSNSNNVATKSIQYLNGNNNVSTVLLANPLNTQNGDFNINITANRNTQIDKNVNDVAEIYITLSDELFDVWASNGREMRGLTYKRGTTFHLSDTTATFYNLNITEGVLSSIDIKVNLVSGALPNDADFGLDITQSTADTLFTGTHINIHYNAARLLTASATAQIVSAEDGIITLSAATAAESATYQWHDVSQTDVGEGQIVSDTIDNHTNTYILEVQSNTDSYKAYDSVTVNLPRGTIESISPNPVANEFTIVCRLDSDVQNARIDIINQFGQTVDTRLLSTSAPTLRLSATSYVLGTYAVSLVIDGITSDSKNFVKTNN